MIIETKSGKVEGYPENGMIAFKGIPFAEAPVGKLRFKPPVPAAPWNGILKAVREVCRHRNRDIAMKLDFRKTV